MLQINPEDGSVYDDGSGDVGPITPVDTPQGTVPPSNDWATGIAQNVRNVIDAATNRVVTQIATPTGAQSSNVRNRPPNGSGVNVQGLNTPGGSMKLFSSQAMQRNGGFLLIVGLVLVAVIAFRARK